MTIMTINTHSYIEDNADRKMQILADAILRLKPDLVAMQEVNQLCLSECVSSPYMQSELGIGLKKDNYALCLSEKINKNNSLYSFSWLGIKHGFEVYDEGLCIFTKGKAEETKHLLISKCTSDDNWKKRMALGVKYNGEWFYNVHMGRWDDNEEPFLYQWKSLTANIATNEKIWLMGDFNSPSDIRNEGYDEVLSDGWYDTYKLADKKDDGYTVCDKIDGWKDKNNFTNKRIDFIFCSHMADIKSSYTIFNGDNEEVISDHFGVIVTY